MNSKVKDHKLIDMSRRIEKIIKNRNIFTGR